MKNIQIAIAVYLTTGAVFAGEMTPTALIGQTTERVQALAQEQPELMDMLLPEQLNATNVALSSLPTSTTSNAVYWMGTVVQSKWLPPDIPSSLGAAKDVRQWEKRDKNGVVISERKGDFLFFNYSVPGYVIHVQESGVSVSLRVDFPRPVVITDDPSSFITNCLQQFLKMPAGALASLKLDLKEEGGAYIAAPRSSVVASRQPVSTTDGRILNNLHWWDRLIICTDGRVFFVQAPEIEPGYLNPHAHPGLPRRF